MRVAFTILLWVTVARGQGQLWVVDDDGGPGVDFTQLQSAIDAASTGDTILVREGLYGSFLLAGKGLVLVADTAASVRCAGGAVQAVHTGSVLVQGIDMDLFPGGLEVGESTAPVWIEQCRITGSPEAVQIRDNTSVALVECVVQGDGGSIGLRVENSPGQQVFVHDSQVLGGAGGDGLFGAPGLPGATGVILDGGRLILSGGAIGGGNGGDGVLQSCPGGPAPFPALGGDGLFVQAGSAYSLDTSISGGASGVLFPAPGCPQGPAGPPGQAIHLAGSGTYTAWAGASVSLDAPSPLREGELSTLTLLGQAPGSPTWLFLSVGQEHLFFPTLSGGLLLPLGNMLISFRGPFPASGPLTIDFTAPDLPVGTDVLGVHIQAALDVPAGPVLTTASFVLFLDASL